MLVKQTSDRIILRDKPGCLWMFGAFFVLVGAVFVYGSLGGFENRNEVPAWVLVASFFMGAIGVGVGIRQIYIYPLSQIFLDRGTRTITIKQIGLFRKSGKTFRFDELDKFFTAQDKDDEGDPIWRVEMQLTGGEEIQLTNIWGRNEDECNRVAETANKFIRPV